MSNPGIRIDVRGADIVVRFVDGVEDIGKRLRSGELDAFRAAEAIDALIAEFTGDAEQRESKGEGKGD